MKTITMSIVVAAACSAASFGQMTITQSQTQNFSGVPDFSQPLVFDQYTGALADLLGITITYNLTIQGGSSLSTTTPTHQRPWTSNSEPD
jgi:hypothetical protein